MFTFLSRNIIFNTKFLFSLIFVRIFEVQKASKQVRRKMSTEE